MNLRGGRFAETVNVKKNWTSDSYSTYKDRASETVMSIIRLIAIVGGETSPNMSVMFAEGAFGWTT